MTETRGSGYVAGEVEFLDPAEHPPPEGRKMILLTEGGVATIGQWQKGFGVKGWHPLPKIPRKLKEN